MDFFDTENRLDLFGHAVFICVKGMFSLNLYCFQNKK